MTVEKKAQELDVTGLKCPLPVLKTQKALRSMSAGEVLTVHATDPVSTVDFPHFCNESGHELIETRRSGDVFSFCIRKKPA